MLNALRDIKNQPTNQPKKKPRPQRNTNTKNHHNPDSAITWKQTTFLSIWETGDFWALNSKWGKLLVLSIQNYRCFNTFICLITFFLNYLFGLLLGKNKQINKNNSNQTKNPKQTEKPPALFKCVSYRGSVCQWKNLIQLMNNQCALQDAWNHHILDLRKSYLAVKSGVTAGLWTPAPEFPLLPLLSALGRWRPCSLDFHSSQSSWHWEYHWMAAFSHATLQRGRGDDH